VTTTPAQVLEVLARRSGVAAIRLHVLVADRCNHRCGHCYQVQGEDGEMSLREILAIIDRFRRQGGLVLSVSGGEATLRADLVDILRYARDAGLATILYTNAYLVDDSLADSLASCDLWRVDVSLYSDVETAHDQLTGISGSWRRTVAGIRRLAGRGIRVQLKTPLTTAAVGTTFERMAALASSLGCTLQVFDQISAGEDGGLAPLEQKLPPAEVAAFAGGDPALDCEAETGLDSALLDRAPCTIASSALTVRSNGALTPCTHVPVEIANLTDGGELEGVLRASEVVGFLRALTWRNVHGCRDCDLLSACGRCHATALAQAGDMLGPYPEACELAVARYSSTTGGGRVPAPGPQSGVNRARGPFRVESDGALTPIPDVVTAEDLALVSRFPWLRGRWPAKGSGVVHLRRNKDGNSLDTARRAP